MSQIYQRFNKFEEISRVKITPNQDIVFSKMIRSNGEVCLFVNHQVFNKYPKPGIAIPCDSLEEFYRAVSDTQGLFPDDKKEVETHTK